MLLDGLKLGTKLLFGHDDETEMFIQGAIPRDVGEGGESDRRTSGFDRPQSYGVEQFPTETLALEPRKNADLLNVSILIDDIDNDVANWLVKFVSGYPAAPADGVSIKLLLGNGFRFCDRSHSDRPERLAGQPLDLSERRAFSWAASANTVHRPILARLSGIPVSSVRTCAQATTGRQTPRIRRRPAPPCRPRRRPRRRGTPGSRRSP